MKKADLIVAASESCADLWYASGFSAPDEFIYVGLPEERFIVVSVLEIDRARSEAKPGVRVYETRDFVPAGSRMVELLKAIADRFGVTGWRLPGAFPVRLAEYLKRGGFSLDLAAGEFFPGREFKSEAEVAHIERSLRTAENAMRRAFEVIGAAGIGDDGLLMWENELLTSERLRMEIDVAIVRDHGIPSGTIAAGGAQAAQPHNTGSGPLKAGTPIVMDIFPRSQRTGYWGDLSRTVVKGSADATVRRAFELVRIARDRSLDRLGPGVSGQDVHMEVMNFFANNGFPTEVSAAGEQKGFFHGLGHGVGLEIHESPRLNSMKLPPLAPGMVVTVEPGLYDPAWGGIRLEDLAVITPDGCRNLTRIETFLEID